MLEQYFPILLFVVVGLAVGVVPVILGSVLGPRKPDPEKLSPYECGFEAFEDARMRFDVRYYLVAILFIVFDIETVFLLPWAAIFTGRVASVSTGFLLIEMVVFLVILAVGYVYVWKRGALQWD